MLFRSEVLNKIDLLPDAERESLLGSGAVAVSAKTGWGIDALLDRVDAALVADPIVEQRFEIPQAEGAILAALGAGALIRERQFEGNLVVMTVAGPASLMGRYRQYWRTARKTEAASRA